MIDQRKSILSWSIQYDFLCSTNLKVDLLRQPFATNGLRPDACILLERLVSLQIDVVVVGLVIVVRVRHRCERVDVESY